MIKQRVARFIERNNLFSPQDKVLVALSGGADSVALLLLLQALGYTCEAAHCNFHLRAEESDRDEEFVRKLCGKSDIPLHVIHFDTRKHSESRKISIEMSARELRYQWFESLREETGAAVVAVAHHRDDSVETMLLNLIRGTGISGLTGIRPVNGIIVRPLLCVSREEIIAYLSAAGQDFVTDSTNLQDEYTRNKIRLKLLPLMQEINPSVKESIAATGNNLSEAFKIYEHSVSRSIQRVRTREGILIRKLLEEPSPRSVLFEILNPLGFNASQVESIYRSLDGPSGKVFISSNDWKLLRDRDLLYLTNKGKEVDTTMPFSLEIEEHPYSPDFVIPRDKDTACFDADKVTLPFSMRKWQKGDYFVPFGMSGKKNVSDYLTDIKMPLTLKESQWVLCSGDKIVWLINERTDNRFRVDHNTRKIIIIRAVPVVSISNK